MNVRLSFFLIIIIITTTTTTTTIIIIIIIIISITKFLIITGMQFELFVIGYHGIRTSITQASMASFAMLPKVFKTYEKRYRCVRSKELIKRHF